VSCRAVFEHDVFTVFKCSTEYVTYSVLMPNMDDPDIHDLARMILYHVALRNAKPWKLINAAKEVAKARGWHLSIDWSTHPCSGYVDYSIDADVVAEFELAKMRKVRKDPIWSAKATLIRVIKSRLDNSLWLEIRERASYSDVHESWGYANIYLLPLEPLAKLRIVEEKEKVVCGPDGYSTTESREIILSTC